MTSFSVKVAQEDIYVPIEAVSLLFFSIESIFDSMKVNLVEGHFICDNVRIKYICEIQKSF